MFFYKYEAVESSESPEKDASVLASDIEEFNKSQPNRTHAYLISFEDECVITMAIAADPMDNRDSVKIAYDFLRSLPEPFCNVSDMDGGEISTRDFLKLLRTAEDAKYISDIDAEMYELGIESFVIHGRTMLKESICDDHMSLGSARKAVSELGLGNDMAQEIERIYASGSPKTYVGIPVHYIIMSDNAYMIRDSVRTLVSALKSRGRLRTSRYTSVGRRTLEREGRFPSLSPDIIPSLFEHQICGAIVLDICGSPIEREEIRENDLDLDSLALRMRMHRSDVLTITVIGRNSNELLSRFVDGLNNMRFVVIRETSFMDEDAKACLKNLAAKKMIKVDEDLVNAIKPDKSYTISDLGKILEQWLDRTMADRYFPQYSNAVRGCAPNTRPKGSAYSQLENLIGLENAKKTMRGIIDYSRLRKVCSSKGLASDCVSSHMVFTGNPGTAKTTVARLFAQIMKDNGILSVGDLVEVGRKDLVGKYVGWTAKLVEQAFNRAKGSVLFIDEAYSLCDGRDGLYGDEAINTIVQLMENQRDDTIVIFAGYTDQMNAFLDRNPGLRSRISFHVDFDDYTDSELVQILEHVASENGVSLAEGVQEQVMEILSQVDHNKAFGNGRYMRNMFEHARMNLATRLATFPVDELTEEKLTTLLPEDFEIVGSAKGAEVRAIGFAC